MPNLNPQIPPKLSYYGANEDAFRSLIENDSWEVETKIGMDSVTIELRHSQKEVLPGISASIIINNRHPVRKNEFEWDIYLSGQAFSFTHWHAGAGFCESFFNAMEAAIEAQRVLTSETAPYYLYDPKKPFDRSTSMRCLSRNNAGRTMMYLSDQHVGEAGFGFREEGEENAFFYKSADGASKSIIVNSRDYDEAFAALSELKDLQLACISLTEAIDMENVILSPPVSVANSAA